jgi:large subunit ribosomal protein L24
MKLKIRKGDKVELISGRLEDKGKQGEVIKVNPDDATVVVQGLNLHSKHQRQVQTQGRTLSPGIVKFETAMPVSKVMLVCPKCGKATRVAVQREQDGKATRICKTCKALIDE